MNADFRDKCSELQADCRKHLRNSATSEKEGKPQAKHERNVNFVVSEIEGALTKFVQLTANDKPSEKSNGG